MFLAMDMCCVNSKASCVAGRGDSSCKAVCDRFMNGKAICVAGSQSVCECCMSRQAICVAEQVL